MWLRRTSSSVWIVGLIIFTVSWVAERPWWQALLFGAGSVFVAALVIHEFKKAAHIRYTQVRMRVRATHNPHFSAAIRAGIASREWDPKTKEWVIDIHEYLGKPGHISLNLFENIAKSRNDKSHNRHHDQQFN